MADTHLELGNPGIWRNDRFWLAGDHVVQPDVIRVPRIKALMDVAEKAKKDFKMTEYQGMNYTIMHTEFVRERAEPGMLAIGSDSHTCSGGAVGCLSIGLGSADVMLTLSLGETWFKVPESIKIEFLGKPRIGVSGKDVILHILGRLKRNTVASERIVEFMGPGCRYLSVDSRFAICNMCTEFGAVTGVFVPDEIARDFVDRRRRKAYKQNSVYFKPDEGADYASEHVIDLSGVENTIAVYPEPDNIVLVSQKAGMKLDGVFIGACTTTEEDLVMAALILKVGLAKGVPLANGKRHYVPGSLPIVDKLEKLGLVDLYKRAGFT
jgi:homoaconitase/3-isopropylmalate dehydratase large subunit